MFRCIMLTEYEVVEKPQENQTPSRSTSDSVSAVSCCELHRLSFVVVFCLSFSSNNNSLNATISKSPHCIFFSQIAIYVYVNSNFAYSISCLSLHKLILAMYDRVLVMCLNNDIHF